MLYLMLATYRKDPKTILGYKLYNFNEKKVIQVSVEQLSDMITKKEKVVNADFVKDKKGIKLVGTNGIVDRYPVVDVATGKVIGKSPLIVLSKLNDGFRLMNAFGETMMLTNKEAVMYCKFNGIANGKITSIKGTETISCISGNYTEEDISISNVRAANKPKGVKAVGKEPNMGEDFYTALEKAFGINRTNIIKHLIETKGAALNVLVEITKSHEKGIALAGLLFYMNNTSDTELKSLLLKIVENSALDIVDNMLDKGIKVDEYWDCPVCLPVHKTDNKKDIDRGFIENCVGNYIVAKGPFEGVTISEDATVAMYKGNEVSRSGYKVAGYNPISNAFTFVSEAGDVKIAQIGKEGK